jgi:hypothetical protein
MLAEASSHLDALLGHVRRHKAEVEAYEAELLERLAQLRAATP